MINGKGSRAVFREKSISYMLNSEGTTRASFISTWLLVLAVHVNRQILILRDINNHLIEITCTA